jgi:hypothetical protein
VATINRNKAFSRIRGGLSKYEASMTPRCLAKRQFRAVVWAHDAARVYFREFPTTFGKCIARNPPQAFRYFSATCQSRIGNLPIPDRSIAGYNVTDLTLNARRRERPRPDACGFDLLT